MPAGKGTYGSKVGRPSKKKKLKKAQAGTTVKGTKGMTYGLGKGYGKFAKAMTKAGKAANAGKTLKKAQPGNIVGAAPAVGSAYGSALKALGLAPAAGLGKGLKSAAIKLGKAASKAKDLVSSDTVSNTPPPPPPILYGPGNPPPPPMPGTEGNPITLDEVTIPGIRKKGGSVTNAKALRNNSRGRARKNR